MLSLLPHIARPLALLSCLVKLMLLHALRDWQTQLHTLAIGASLISNSVREDVMWQQECAKCPPRSWSLGLASDSCLLSVVGSHVMPLFCCAT